MDEKTESLRDLFVETTGSESVTERQSESPGSLVDRDEAATASRALDLVAAMRERYGFETDLDDAAYVRVARGHFAGEDDAAIAAALAGESAAAGTADVDAATVRDARLDLHLVADADRDVSFEYAALRRALADDATESDAPDAGALAAALDADADAVANAVPVARADLASTRANDRYRDGFRALLTDADIEGSHAATAREDGLEEATEDIETDVSL